MTHPVALQRGQPVPPPPSHGRPAQEEKWDVRADLESQAGESRPRVAEPPQPVERHERRGRIAGSPAEARPVRDPLRQAEFGPAAPAGLAGQEPGRPDHEVVVAGRKRGIVRGEPETTAARRDQEPVLEVDRLEECHEVVIAVGPATADPETEIQLGRSPDREDQALVPLR